MLTVCTFKWYDPAYRWNNLFIYGSEHVNKLYRAVSRNLDLPHKFVCITDDPRGLDPAIEVVPLWEDLRSLGGCYTRLRAFAPDMEEILGPRFVWMDLDCVVTGDLTPLFSRTEDFIIWSNGTGPTPYCGSMVMMHAGARKQVWEDFKTPDSIDAGKAKGYIGTDQAWIATCLGSDEAIWTKKDGVLSRLHLPGNRLPNRAKRLTGAGPGALPKNTRVVFWHGPMDPSQPTVQSQYPWVKEHWI